MNDSIVFEAIILIGGLILQDYKNRLYQRYGFPIGSITLQYGGVIAVIFILYAVIALFGKYGFGSGLAAIVVSLIIFILPWWRSFRQNLQYVSFAGIIIGFIGSLCTF